jgi:hypothetical protein
MIGRRVRSISYSNFATNSENAVNYPRYMYSKENSKSFLDEPIGIRSCLMEKTGDEKSRDTVP